MPRSSACSRGTYSRPSERARSRVRAALTNAVDGTPLRSGTQRWIANLGHGMHPDHDPAMAKAFIDAVHEISERINRAAK